MGIRQEKGPPPRLMKQVSAALKLGLKVSGRTQAAVAHEVGISTKHMNQIVNGKNFASPEILGLLFNAVGVTVEFYVEVEE